MKNVQITNNVNWRNHIIRDTISIDNNIDNLEKINNAVDWSVIQKYLEKETDINKPAKNVDEVTPIFLFKCMVIKRIFGISRNIDLINEINNRIYLKQFLGLPLNKPSPDYTALSICRNRFSRKDIDNLFDLVIGEIRRSGFDPDNEIVDKLDSNKIIEKTLLNKTKKKYNPITIVSDTGKKNEKETQEDMNAGESITLRLEYDQWRKEHLFNTIHLFRNVYNVKYIHD